MTYQSTLTSKNQTTLPKAVVKALGASPSCKLTYEDAGDGKFLLTARTESFASLAGSFPKKKPTDAVSLREMDSAIHEASKKQFQKSVK